VQRVSGSPRLPEMSEGRSSEVRQPFQSGAGRLPRVSTPWMRQPAPRWKGNPRHWSCGLHPDADHTLAGCRHFLGMPVGGRFELVSTQGRCFKCLGGHWRQAGESCPDAKRCGMRGCRSWLHHPLLHRVGSLENTQSRVTRYFYNSSVKPSEAFSSAKPGKPRMCNQACQVDLGGPPVVSQAGWPSRSEVEERQSARVVGGDLFGRCWEWL